MANSIKTTLMGVGIGAIFICAGLAIALILNLAPSDVLRSTLIKCLEIVGVIAVVSIAVSFVLSLGNKTK